ncbi:MAG: RNA polymerase subunit sigma-70 [Bacteroidales bacterium]|nr:RNA polymerase subunit sigma-70 [Bacteroidales bacterium]
MVRATISADIVSSTALSVEELTLLQSEIRQFLEGLSEKSQSKDWGRLFKGDSVEIFLFDPHEALRTALLLKTLVKKTSIAKNKSIKRELFRRYGLRLALGIGEMRTSDKALDILDGEAIYYSGRLLEKAVEEKQINKRTMFFACKDPVLTEQMDVILGLLDALLKEATPRQSEILYYKILGMNESEIAEMLRIKQPVVNQHSNSLNWKSIEATLNYFEKLNFES